MPGMIMMMDTIVPSSRKKEKARRVTVELYVEGQHPDKRQGAEPHRQDAYNDRNTINTENTHISLHYRENNLLYLCVTLDHKTSFNGLFFLIELNNKAE